MIRLVLAAAALLAASAAPAPAQEAPNPIVENWKSLQTALGNVQNSIVRMLNDNTALLQQSKIQDERIRALTEKCGAPCQDTPPQVVPPSPQPPKQ